MFQEVDESGCGGLDRWCMQFYAIMCVLESAQLWPNHSNAEDGKQLATSYCNKYTVSTSQMAMSIVYLK